MLLPLLLGRPSAPLSYGGQERLPEYSLSKRPGLAEIVADVPRAVEGVEDGRVVVKRLWIVSFGRLNL